LPDAQFCNPVKDYPVCFGRYGFSFGQDWQDLQDYIIEYV
jgi:hypothetical protein